jgi:hypothetical protein
VFLMAIAFNLWHQCRSLTDEQLADLSAGVLATVVLPGLLSAVAGAIVVPAAAGGGRPCFRGDLRRPSARNPAPRLVLFEGWKRVPSGAFRDAAVRPAADRTGGGHRSADRNARRVVGD